MLLSLTLVCLVALVGSTLLLLALGHRLRLASRLLGAGLSFAVAIGAGEAAARIWQLPSHYVLEGQGLLIVAGVAVVAARPRWNPTGQVFFGCFLAAAAA